MALSQKHQGKILVPWFNSEEWRMVYNLIYSENSTESNKLYALNILRTWKARTPLLFAGVEGTLIVLEALLVDEKLIPEEQICCLLATAIMRFLNICAANSDRQGTFYQTAKKKNLPDWLINIRHDLAHSQKLPSKFMLDLSLKYCLEWLKNKYWDLQNNVIEDCVMKPPNNKSKINVEDAVNVYCDLILMSLTCEDKAVLDDDLFLKLGIHVKNTISVIEISNKLLSIISKYKYSEDNKVIDVIIENGGIFMIPDNSLKDQNKCIPQAILQAWEGLLQYLQEQSVLILLIKKLFDVICNETLDKIREISSLWLNEIFKGLLRENLINGKHKISRTRKSNKLKDTFCLSFSQDTNLINQLSKFKNHVLSLPNVYTKIFLKNLLHICACNTNFIADVELAMQSYLYIDQTLSADEKLYSIQDLDALSINVVEDTETSNTILSTPMDAAELCNNIGNGFSITVNKGRWHQVEDTSDFNGCPLGILPHQNRNTNPLLKSMES